MDKNLFYKAPLTIVNHYGLTTKQPHFTVLFLPVKE